MHRFPRAVLDLMERQHELITRSQLGRHVPLPVVDGWVRRGVLERVHRGVYRLPGLVFTEQQPLLAAVLRCGDGARAGGLASGWLYGLDGIALPEQLEVVIPEPRHLRRERLPFAVRATTLPQLDITNVEGVPCLSATRALIEMAPRVSERTVRVALDSARRKRLTSLWLVHQRVQALGQLHGARVLGRILGVGVLQPESEGERLMQAFLAPLGLPLEWGVTDLVPGRRLDAVYRLALVAFEYDGRDHHVLPTDRDSDGVRDLEAAERGVLVVRITAGMIRDKPVETLARIAQICATRANRFRAAAS